VVRAVGGRGGDTVVTCAALGLEQAVLAPALGGAGSAGSAGSAAGAAVVMGADTADVLAWLGMAAS
jgi:hypothetical protein